MDKKAVMQYNLKEIKIKFRLEYKKEKLEGNILVTDLFLQSVLIKGTDVLESYSILQVLKSHK